MFVAWLFAMSAKPWTLVCGGDIMLNGISPKAGALRVVRALFAKADVAYANLEIPLTRAKVPTPRKSKADLKAKRQFVLKADPAHIGALGALGLDLVSLGNNHAMDYGDAGLVEMTRLLDSKRIGWAGAGPDRASANRAAAYQVPGGPRVKLISYLAFRTPGALWTCHPATDEQAGIAVADLGGTIGTRQRAWIEHQVASAKGQGDLLLVALHWGIEKETSPSGYQVALGRAFIDAGADVVLGSHPHVLQGTEVYKGRPILYSLGNLVSPRPASTAVYELSFVGNAFSGLRIVPARIQGGRTSLLSEKEAVRALKSIHALDRKIPRQPSVRKAK